MNIHRRRRRTIGSMLCMYSTIMGIDGFAVLQSPSFSRQRIQGYSCPSEKDGSSGATTMSTALCIVPPDEAWDTIQRARHLARDRTYHKWPPALRLFHPFCPRAQLSDTALAIARIVEEYNIEPFEVSLNSWTIIPHMEAIEADWDAMHRQSKSYEEKEDVPKNHETEADQLIAEEERKGRERLLTRGKQKRQRRLAAGKEVIESHSEKVARQEEEKKNRKQSPQELLREKQKRMYEEFNGPCVLCLEPDEESKEQLIQLRKLLRDELFDKYDKFSPSSSVSTTSSLPRAVRDAKETSFRPIVPIGSFPTVSSAVEMARKLKGLWEPLPFNVTDFQLLSYESEVSSPENQFDEFSDNMEFSLKPTSWRHADIEEETLTCQGQFGCDALVMFMGEELDTDEEGSKEMVDIILSQGSPGGYELLEKEAEASDGLPPESFVKDESNDEQDNGTEDLELWLDSDDEWDEGTVIVIGRTHFFTGEMRAYSSMPASSVMDAKDRVPDVAVHALARRRGSPRGQK